jgi:hypothetical protein
MGIVTKLSYFERSHWIGPPSPIPLDVAFQSLAIRPQVLVHGAAVYVHHPDVDSVQQLAGPLRRQQILATSTPGDSMLVGPRPAGQRSSSVETLPDRQVRKSLLAALPVATLGHAPEYPTRRSSHRASARYLRHVRMATAACERLGRVSLDAASKKRDLIAFIGIVVATPLALLGLALPIHDYAGLGPELERLVSGDMLFLSTIFTSVAAGVAVVPIAVWPRLALRVVAVVVLAVALWNLVDVLSYHWWRSDLVFCQGGCG